uniref:NS n=1 Tax=Avian chapparvovirus TaxID=2604334 RepID=A0A7D5BPF6_9VIRU|nr:NS [Avian chapparvovirus]
MSREMGSPRTDFGTVLWVGSSGTSRDIRSDQAETLLITKDFVLSPEPDMTRQLNLLDMKQFQCCIMQINDAQGEPIINPLIYAMLFNDLPTINSWVCTGEVSAKHIFHVHAMVQTSQRTDSLRRSINTAMTNLNAADNFRTLFGQQIVCECLKLERTHKPSSMFAYMLKQPVWCCSNNEKWLQLAYDMDCYNLPDRFRPKLEEEEHPEMNAMTQELVDAIIAGGCKSFEDVVRTAPSTIAKYLHRPGIQAIVANCIVYVKATGGNWNIELFAKHDINPSAIHQILLFQGIPPSEFDTAFHAWITKRDPKRNTICIQGPSNTGKSMFISGLKQCAPWGEIINSNTFAFEGLVETCIGIWEEPLCSPELAEKAKQVLEGMPTNIPIKYKKPFLLPRTPILITTNHDLWRFCTREEPMFRNRMWIFPFMHEMKDQFYICRTSEHGCECAYCRASRGSTDADGSSKSSGMQKGNEPIPTGEQSIRTDTESEMGSGSMSDPGEGTSRGYSSTRRSSSSSPDSKRTHFTGSSISTCTSIERLVGYRKHKSSDSGNGIRSTESSSSKHVESTNSGRGNDGTSRDVRDTKPRKLKRFRNTGSDGSDRGKRVGVSSLERMETTPKKQKKIQLQSKERRLGGTMDPFIIPGTTNVQKLPMQIPTKNDWEQYISYIHHWYG